MAKRDLVKLLVKLYGDPKLHGQLGKTPSKVMKAAKLNAQEQEILASGDEAKIRDYLGKESLKANIIQSVLSNIIQTAIKPKKK